MSWKLDYSKLFFGGRKQKMNKNKINKNSPREFIGKPYSPEIAREINGYGILTNTSGEISGLIDIKSPDCEFHRKCLEIRR